MIRLNGAISALKNAYGAGKVVYSTGQKSAGTMFDAFVVTMSKNAQKNAKAIVRETEQKAGIFSNSKLNTPEVIAKAKNNPDSLVAIAEELLASSKADAVISYRVKGVNSTADKIKKKFDIFKNSSYENEQDKIKEIILGNGVREIVGDSFGMRFILNSEKTGKMNNSTRVYRAMAEKHTPNGNTKGFSLTSFEDYYGKGVEPYSSKPVRDSFAHLKYISSQGTEKNTLVAFTKKPSGYTRTNTDALINGVKTEIQIGGKHTTKWGDVEHVLYDTRQGKRIDLSHYTDEQKQLANEIIREYKKLLGQPADVQAPYNKYLNEVWGNLRAAEQQNLSIPVLSGFPEGLPDVLRAENIMKLAHV